MRAMKRLALVALFALPMAMTGCEKLGDATGPDLSKVEGPSAARVKVVVQADTSGASVGGVVSPPPSGYDPAWP